MTTLTKLARVLEGMTPGPWDLTRLGIKVIPDDRVPRWTDADLVEGYIYHADALGITLLRNVAPLLLKVCEAAAVISASVHSSGDPHPVGINDLDDALVDLKAALEAAP